MSGGGGGGSGTTRYEWNDAMAPYWGSTLQDAQTVARKPFEQYGDSRVAPWDTDQTNAMGAIRNYVNDPSGYLYGRGVDQFYNTVEGKYLDGDKANPYSSINSHVGQNPMFENQVRAGMQDITDAYQQGTAADTTRLFNMSGAFGGSAHQNAVANNETGLAKQLANYDRGMRSEEYNRSAQLEESALNRGSQNYENERGRQMQAGLASQADQGLTFDRYNQLMNIGNMRQNQNQRVMDVNYQNWFDRQNYGKNQLAWLSGILGAAQGGLAPNQITSGGSSPWANAAGAGLAAYGLFRS